MRDGVRDILRRVEAEGIETIRVVFTDPHGVLRGKTVTAAALESALQSGLRIPSTLLLKDLSHRTAFPVWQGEGAPMRGASDVLLFPDPTTFRVLPHSPHSAMLHAEVSDTDRAPIVFSSHQVLQTACDALSDFGFDAIVGLEVEFQVFDVVDPGLSHGDATMPGKPPITRNTTQGYQYLTETRYAEAEALLDDIRRSAEAMGMPVRSVEIEMGPSQFEFTFAPGPPMRIAEMAVNFRTLAKEICHRHGKLASFMAKPGLPNAAANGWHIHQSLIDASGEPLFAAPRDGPLSQTASHWLAGLLEHAAETCLLTVPTVTGYKRFSDFQLAPNRIGWGIDNRGAMVRFIGGEGDAATRLENRIPESGANPYFALAAQIASGVAGLRAAQPAGAPMDNPYGTSAPRFPATLGDAIAAWEANRLFAPEVTSYLATLKRFEWNRYLAHISDWEQAEYFTAL